MSYNYSSSDIFHSISGGTTMVVALEIENDDADYGGGAEADGPLGSQGEQICGEYETYTLARFLFVSCASVLALFGLAANLALFALFSTRKSREQTNTPRTLYPRVLALLDACICAAYILLFGADAAVIYLRIRPLFTLYHAYIVPAFAISRMTQLAIPYMLIFATLERLVWTGSGKLRNPLLRRMYSIRGRQVTVGVTLGACVLLRLPTMWAVVIHEFPQCQDFFRTISAGPADWVLDGAYSHAFYVYEFHLLSVTQTFFPFFVLLAFNSIVVRRVYMLSGPSDFSPALLQLPASSSSASSHSAAIRRCSSRHGQFGLPRRSSFIQRFTLNGPVRAAVFTMVAITASYLISNSLHLALTILERSNSALLRDPEDPSLASTFHTVFSDVVSFVYMFTSAIRILIYYICNPAIRADIRAWLPSLSRRRSLAPEMAVHLTKNQNPKSVTDEETATVGSREPTRGRAEDAEYGTIGGASLDSDDDGSSNDVIVL